MSTRSKKKRQANEADLDDTNPHKKRRLSHSQLSQNKSNNEIMEQITCKKIKNKKPANDERNNKISQTQEAESSGNDDFDEFDDFDENDNTFEDKDKDKENDWDNLGELNYDGQETIEIFNPCELSKEELLLREKDKRRKLNSNVSRFWKCGKCEFLNHPSNAQCFSCNMPEIDIIRYLLNCSQPLQKCQKCNAYIIPKQYKEHELDCEPIKCINNEKNKNNNSIKNEWYCKLSKSEKNAVCYVTNLAFRKSEKEGEKEKLLNTISKINIESDFLFGAENEEMQIYDKLLRFLEWKVPITIRIHCAELIPRLLQDTNYRNLFETGYGSGNTDECIRKREEMKMFGEVYFGAEAFERPKYGCLNINLSQQGCLLAKQYGDGYFVLNNTTVRWRVTMTIKDSFAVNGECATLKNCIHLLNELENDELKQIIQVAVFGKCDQKNKNKQKAYREIQIHGPVILNRDIYSLHIPNNQKNRQLSNTFQLFCQKNDIKLVWF